MGIRWDKLNPARREDIKDALVRVERAEHRAELAEIALDEVKELSIRRLREAEERRTEAIQTAARAMEAKFVAERLLAEAQERERRLLYLAEHLFQMVPQSVWRDTGGDDMQGHYEGDYHAAKLQEELAQYRAAQGGTDEAA